MGHYITRRDQAGLESKVSELNISMILAGDKNKGEYILSDQVGKY